MEQCNIIGLKEVMEITGLGEKAATKLLKNKNCPTLPRKRREKYHISKDALMRYLARN